MNEKNVIGIISAVAALLEAIVHAVAESND